MSYTLLAATTSAVASGDVGVRSNESATLIADNLAGAENADIQISHDGGTTWADLFQNGAQVRMTATNNAVTVYGPGIYRVDKEATAGACGIFVSTDKSL